MNKISCDICIDLMPLVKDEVASDDSKKAVHEHIKSCADCKHIYGEEVIFENSEKKILNDMQKHLTYMCIIIIGVGILLGSSLTASQDMFYNILIMPTIGAMSYLLLEKKSIYVCMAVFVASYLKCLYDISALLLENGIGISLIAPLFWPLIYVALTACGILIAALLHFGFSKED